MISVKSQDYEIKRLSVLKSYGPPPVQLPGLTELVQLASGLSALPMGLLTWFDEATSLCLASFGIEAVNLPHRQSFCRLVVESGQPLLVKDTGLLQASAELRLVTESPKAQVYAGVPLRSPEGFVLGVFSLLSAEPQPVSQATIELLIALSGQVMALLESERRHYALVTDNTRYQTALNSARVGIWEIVDAEQQECWISPELFTLLELRGNVQPGLEALLKRIHPDDLPGTLLDLAQLPNSPEWAERYLRMSMPDGDYRWFAARGQTVWDSQRSLFKRVGTIEDADLQQKELFERERSQIFLARLDRIGLELEMPLENILEQSLEVLCEYYGLSSCGISRVQGGVLEILAIHDPPAQPQGRDLPLGFKIPLAGSIVGQIYDCEGVVTFDDLPAADNPQRHSLLSRLGVETLIGSVFSVQGEPYGVVSCFGYEPRPAGFNQHAREFMARFCHWLGFMFERRYHLDHLHRVSHSKDRLLAVIAHDLRNPLAAIVSAKRRLDRVLLKDEVLDPKMLAVIESSSLNATHLIDELLEADDVIEQQILKLPLEPLNLTSFVTELLLQFEPRATARQLSLSWLPETEIAMVALNPRKMARALDNLLHNALKFTSDGGAIQLELSLISPRVKLRIVDTGIGIPEHLLESLFSTYGSARRQGLGGEPSTGLGLSIVKEIIDLHGGQISVTSQVDGAEQGTCVEIILPLVREISLPRGL